MVPKKFREKCTRTILMRIIISVAIEGELSDSLEECIKWPYACFPDCVDYGEVFVCFFFLGREIEGK